MMTPNENQQEESTKRYIRSAAASQPLSRGEEAVLAARIRQGDLEARDRLVQANLLFVISVAKDYLGCGMSLADLTAAGNHGLMKAAGRFDGTRNVKFITYAVWWIRQTIMKAITEDKEIVHIPNSHKIRVKRSAEEQLEQDDVRNGTPFIADPEHEESTHAFTVVPVFPLVFLDAIGNVDTISSLILTQAGRNEAADVLLEQRQRIQQVDSLIDSLPPREAKVIQMYFGLRGEEVHTLLQIGRFMNITRERVRQIKKRALDRLQTFEARQCLEDLKDTKTTQTP